MSKKVLIISASPSSPAALEQSEKSKDTQH